MFMMLFLNMFIDCLHKIDAFQMKHLGDINVLSEWLLQCYVVASMFLMVVNVF